MQRLVDWRCTLLALLELSNYKIYFWVN
jgi:hypothetical protein